jgi:ElaB/YqjD/DUF883 family membrane-anchored ribosome-binding protein
MESHSATLKNGSNDGHTAMSEIGRELKSSAMQVGSALKSATSAIRDDLGVAAKETYSDLVASGKAEAKELAGQVGSKVQHSPLLAIGIAFGLGMVACSFLSKR